MPTQPVKIEEGKLTRRRGPNAVNRSRILFVILLYFPRDYRWQLLARRVTLKEFGSWPPVEPSLFEAGIPLKAVREALKEGATPVRVFPGGGIQVIDVPARRVLEAGRRYRFAVRSSEFEQVALIVGDGKVHFLRK